MPKAILEPLVAEMRIHNDNEAVYGDAYQFGVVVRYLTPTSVQVDLLKSEGGFGMGHIRAIKRELASHGVTDWIYYRIKNGVKMPVKGRTK